MRYFIFLFVLPIVFACSRDNDQHECSQAVHEIKIKISDQNLQIKDILKSADFRFLFADINFIIGEVDKIVPHNQRFYILDKKQHAVIVFDDSGRYAHTFFKKGFGPAEYNNINDFTIFKNMICILDTDKIFMYSLTGDFIKKIKLAYTATKFENIDDRYFAFYRHSNMFRAADINYNLLITDEKGQILHKHFPYTIEDEKNNISTKDVFYSSNGEVTYINRFNDTIFSLSDGYLKPKYFINFGKDKMPANPLDDNRYLKYPHFIKNFAENENHLVFSFSCSENVYHAVYDKNSRESICYRSLSTDDRYMFKGRPVFAANNGFCSVLEPYEDAMHLPEIKNGYPEAFDKMVAGNHGLKAFLAYIDEGQLNPVLIFEEYKSIEE